MSDDEIIDVDEASQELVPAGAPPATLFRTDEPGEIVFRATQVANSLSAVLKEKNLTVKIGQKEHVVVEGWTLCGTMLGVYPVVEWTRKIENGWEARVEARTRDGAVVGAAEAECLSTENRWKSADDYAIRSMAQTRAISKALRAPLGFIVSLAGFNPTPAEEIEREPPAAAKPFDPETDLLPGAIHGEGAPKRIADALNGLDPTVDWQDVIFQAVGQDWRGLTPEEQKDFWRRLSNAVEWITQAAGTGDFPPVEADKIVAGFAYAFSGTKIEVVYQEPFGAPFSKEEADAIQENLAKEDIEFPDGKS